MDDLRDSFSRFKHRLGKSKRKADKPGGGREQEGGGPNTGNENVGTSSAADDNRPDWKSTASSSAKLVLRGVRDSADAFGPLKSIAGGLCFILENCEVRCFLSQAIQGTYVSPANKSKQAGNRVVGTSGQRARRTALRAR